MARSYAQFSTSMWRNDDFVALPSTMKMVYMLLSSQPDVSAVGVLHLSVTRWAGKSPDTTPADINRALDGLAVRRFIIIDRASEEVLIRAFLRWDNGYKNPKRLPAIRDAANEIESRTVVAALAAEFDRVDLNQSFRGQCSTSIQYDARPDAEKGSFPQVEGLSDSHPDSLSPSERRVPQPPTPNPQPVPPSAGSASARPGQATLEGMPEPPKPEETDEQIAFRLSRAWEKTRKDAGKPIIPRGKRKQDVVLVLKTLIVGAVGAGYTEVEINEALQRCNQGVPPGSTFDKAIERIREESQGANSVMPFNPPHIGGNSTYTAPSHRSTGAQRAEQAMSVAAQLRAEAQNGAHT